MNVFRIDELLQMAMHAEQAGKDLYATMAAQAQDPKVADLCRELAAQEAAHYAKFKAMRERLPVDYASKTLSLDEVEFVRSLARGNVIPTDQEARRLVSQNSPAAVLDSAIVAERNSQEFYSQLMSGVAAADASVLKAIISEEKLHEKRLTQVRAKMSA